MDNTPIYNKCSICNITLCKECMKDNKHNTCIECGDEITCMKNNLCKTCDRHPFDMDVENTKNMSLEEVFDSILTRNFEEYKVEEKKPVNKPVKKYKK